jgi:hypothetical protein
VIVPVLSSNTERASPSFSIVPAPFTMTPARAARDNPEMSAIGAARINGHGVATTNTDSARTGSPEIAHAIVATTIVAGRKNNAVATGHPGEHRPVRGRQACNNFAEPSGALLVGLLIGVLLLARSERNLDRQIAHWCVRQAAKASTMAVPSHLLA